MSARILPEKFNIRVSPLERLRHIRGFTLIELLVAIAIIAVLASLLLPALSAAKFRAKNVTCQSNLRQLGLLLALYTETHDAYVPDQLLAADGRTNTGLIFWKFENRGRFDPVALCPFNKGWARSDGQTAAILTLYAYNRYGVVGHLTNTHLGLAGAVGPSSNSFMTDRPPKTSMVVAPSDMIAFGDWYGRAEDPSLDGYWVVSRRELRATFAVRFPVERTSRSWY